MIRIHTSNERLAADIAEAFLEAEELLEGLRAICRKYNIEQCPEEIFWLLAMMGEINSVLEIGVSLGGIAMWSYLLPEGGFYIGVDTRTIPLPGHAYLVGRQIDVITGDSHREETVKKVESTLQGKLVDLLFIGDHSYSSVRSHYGNYSRFVRKGGAVAFNHCNEKNDVYEFFNELRGRKEICNNKNGMGLLFI